MQYVREGIAIYHAADVSEMETDGSDFRISDLRWQVELNRE